jgi:hypothetical protein
MKFLADQKQGAGRSEFLNDIRDDTLDFLGHDPERRMEALATIAAAVADDRLDQSAAQGNLVSAFQFPEQDAVAATRPGPSSYFGCRMQNRCTIRRCSLHWQSQSFALRLISTWRPHASKDGWCMRSDQGGCPEVPVD